MSLDKMKRTPSSHSNGPAGKQIARPRPAHQGALGVPSLRKEAYDKIKHRIITCVFRPGEYINELQLSAALKIGRTPVHQALDRLMVEGMVEVIPRKGVIVKPVSLNEVLQIIDIRLINEPYAARLAAAQATRKNVVELTDVLRRTKQSTALRDVESLMLLDREFHLLIATITKNHILADVLRNLHERSLRFWFISLNAPAQFQKVQKEHGAILEAIRQRAQDKAESAMRSHIESFRVNVSQFL